MQELYSKTIREIAVEFPQTVRILEECQIDYFCCCGKRRFSDACQFAGISPETVKRIID